MKFIKKIFILSLAFSFLFVFTVSANAAEFNLTALGDSIAQGFGVAPDKNFVYLSYQNLVKRLTGTSVTSDNLAINGSDSWLLLNGQLKRDLPVSKIQKAEAVIISVGGNDVYLPINDLILNKVVVSFKGGTMPVAQNMLAAEAVNIMIDDYFNSNPNDACADDWDYLWSNNVDVNSMAYIDAVECMANLPIDYYSLFSDKTDQIMAINFDAVKKDIATNVTEFTKSGGNFEQIISKIHSINPTAKIAVISTYNPYKPIESLIAIYRTNISTNVSLGTDPINQKISSYATAGNYTFVDIAYNIENQTAFSWAFGNLYTNITEGDPHPNISGHNMIYKKLIPFLDSLSSSGNSTPSPTTSPSSTPSPRPSISPSPSPTLTPTPSPFISPYPITPNPTYTPNRCLSN